MKIGFYLENENIREVDLTLPIYGNPGCGGTEYLMSSLPFYIQKYSSKKCQTVLLANQINRLPKGIPCIKAENEADAAFKAHSIGCKILIYRLKRHPQTDLLNSITSLNLSAIAWAHINPTSEHLRQLALTDAIKAVVCVEHEQYDLMQDTAIINKLTYIRNGFDIDGFRVSEPPPKEDDLVVYLGALVPQKGFHLLARVWPQVLKKHPAAKLSVIGTGALYDSQAKLGHWGIAHESYEKEFIPYLLDSEGHIHPSVKFIGKLGLEKKSLLYRASIGVINPTGQTENCPGSALEFQACGTPVVAGAYYGLLDTVKHDQTGLLARNYRDLENKICYLLSNPDIALKMGEEGVNFVKRKYSYETIIREWIELFRKISENQPIEKKAFKKNIHRHQKAMIIANRWLRVMFGNPLYWPSTKDIKIKILAIIRYFRKRAF